MATTTPATGWPDATNTGVPAGVTLLPSGDIVVTKAGTVISGLDIHGTVYINADNVTLENCKITSDSFNVVQIVAGRTGCVVQDCEINGVGSGNDGSNGILGTGTFLRNDIYNVENGITLNGNNTVIEGNYIHDLKASGAPHYDGIQIDGGVSNVTISHNTVINSSNQTSAVMIDNYFGPISNIKVDNNLLVGGGYTVYSDGQFTGGSITGVSFTNNHLGIGGWGYTSFNKNSPTYTGNVNDGNTLVKLLNSGANTGDGTTTPPDPLGAPHIDKFAGDSGMVGDGITNDNTVTLTGAAAANSTVKVFDGGKQVGTVTANSSGSWSYTTSAVADGAHKFTATATSGSTTSAASNALSVTVDTAAPTAPTIKASTSTGAVAGSTAAVLVGIAEANSSVKIYDGANQVGQATADANGAWTFTATNLATGNHSFTAKATDVAGNVSAASTAVAVSVSPSTPTAPSAPTIVSYSNDSGVAGDNITNDNSLTLTGKAAANSTVKIFDGATQIGTTTAKADGSWTYTTPVLNDAKHTLTAKVTDSGQTSAASSALAVTIDTTAPGAPTIASSPTSAAAATVAAKAEAATTANTFKLSGTAEANSVVSIFDGAKQIGTVTTNSNGSWSFATDQLATGTHSFTAKAADLAGNVGAMSSALSVNVSPSTPTVPTAPVISSMSRDTGKVGDKITSDSTLTLTGTAVADTTVKVFDGTKQLGTATADHNGAWSYTTAVLADGAHSLSAKAMDTAGHTSTASSPLAVTIDTHAPTAPTMVIYGDDGKVVGATTTADDLTLKGTAEANSTVSIFDSGKQIGTASADSKGVWSFDTGHLSDGSHNFSSKASDVAGNVSSASSVKAVSIQDAPTASGVDITKFSSCGGDGVMIKGTADAYTQIKIFDGSKALGVVKADANGAWSYSSSSVSDTMHTFSAKQLDASGHTVASSGNAILGSTGSNVLKGTSGDDTLIGNGNSDTFVFAPSFGNDVIKDFNTIGPKHDVVQFSKSVFDSFADVLAHATQHGQDVVIATGADSLTLKNIKIGALDKSDFHFA